MDDENVKYCSVLNANVSDWRFRARNFNGDLDF